MDGGDETKKNRVLEFAENHPYILLIAVGVLFVLLLVMYFGGCGWSIGSSKGNKKKKKSSPLDDDEEMDELIEQIHAKQRKKKCAQ